MPPSALQQKKLKQGNNMRKKKQVLYCIYDYSSAGERIKNT